MRIILRCVVILPHIFIPHWNQLISGSIDEESIDSRLRVIDSLMKPIDSDF